MSLSNPASAASFAAKYAAFAANGLASSPYSVADPGANENIYALILIGITTFYVVKGGIDYAKKMLMNAFGPEQAKKLMDPIGVPLQDAKRLAGLQVPDPKRVVP